MDRISGRSLAARLFGASPARTLALLHAAWPLAVGPELARRTEVLGLEGGTLRLRVPDARWRKVLHRMQPQILAQLRELAGDLAPRRMGFTEGGFAADRGVERRAAAVDDGGFQGGTRTPNQPGVSAPPEISIERRAAAVDDGGFQGGTRTPNQPGVSAPPEISIERRAAAVDDGGFQGGSRVPTLPGTSAPPEIKAVAAQIADPEIRERFVAAATRYLARSKDSKGRTHA